jgi:uncharacterized membrane protein
VVIAIIIIAVVVVAAAAAVVVLRHRRAAPADPAAGSRSPRPEPAPMRGLEDALNQVTDRSGTTMAARLDAEEAHVDDLRDIDDTGPLLRRALDHVTPTESEVVPDGHDATAISDTGTDTGTDPGDVADTDTPTT